MNFRKRLFVIINSFLLLMTSPLAQAEEKPVAQAVGVWTILNEVPQARAAGRAWVRPERFLPVMLDLDGMKSALVHAPVEAPGFGVRGAGFVVELPMPNGRIASFEVVESSIMEPGLAAKFPEIRTYLGQGLDDPTATVRFDVTPSGFHSQVISSEGAAYIDPYTFGDTSLYTSYWKRDLAPRDEAHCLVTEREQEEAVLAALAVDNAAAPRTSGATRKQYRLACAATGEYTAFHGGTVALGQAAIVTAINRVTQVYELEVAVRLVLVANNNLLVFTDGLSDPYTNTNGSAMLGENQSTVTGIIGTANYDIGHVFSTGGGGVASLSVVCSSGSKARGVTGLTSPIGDGFYIDFVAHEMGHQFSGTHSFNGSSSNCGTNRTSSTAFEPGSGSTIMSYAGVCSSQDNLQAHSDAYFHSISHEQIMNFVNNVIPACGTSTATGNNPPTVNAGPNYTIPGGTPYVLTATGSDPNGDTVTYCWEERDLGPAQLATDADNGSSPIVRSRVGTTSPSRTCPSIGFLLLNNYAAKAERLPNLPRSGSGAFKWRVTARDNIAGAGGVFSDNMEITVYAAGGVFSVTSPNTAVSWSGLQTVTWNVSGTNAAPVNCANVKILLSTDGGNTWPTVLVASTANDGSENVTLPNINTTTARIRVEAIGNIFFEISNVNFTITPGLPGAPTSVVATPSSVCSGDASSLTANVGPGEAVDWYTGGCGIGGGGSLVGTNSPFGVNPAATTTYFAQGRNIGSGLVGPCTTVTVTVAPLGDANGSGMVEITDVGPFVDGVVSGSGSLLCALDMNGDTLLDGVDIVLFTDTLAP